MVKLFVGNLPDKKSADDAVQNLHQYILHGVAINVENSRGKPKASTKLHVSNLGDPCTPEELRSKFEAFGTVLECDIVKDYAFVHMETEEDALEAIRNLDTCEFKGVHGVTVNLELETVLVETTLSAQDIQTMLESSGRKAVLTGLGTNESRNLGAAVAMLSGEGLIQGVVRFLQASEDNCIIDGTLDGLSPGLHGVHIHEFGDLSEGCASCGEHYNPDGSSHGAPGDIDHHVGDLGNIFANDDGQAAFRMENERVKVWNIIGRSLVVDEKEDDLGQGNDSLSKITGNSGRRLACGIIARSAGLFENAKKICACDGVTIWEERECPIAGPERKRNKEHSANL
uniref:Superoxide dismutase [Cu-Zn] n=1 Tax=Leptobrachium leishanense TaxID=445787 RepID=A0A8C5N405_9ANUR